MRLPLAHKLYEPSSVRFAFAREGREGGREEMYRHVPSTRYTAFMVIQTNSTPKLVMGHAGSFGGDDFQMTVSTVDDDEVCCACSDHFLAAWFVS